MQEKEFKDLNDNNLIIIVEKSSIIFETDKDNKDYIFSYSFNKEDFREILDFLKESSINIWNSFKLKDVTGLSSDYSEYYDRKLDSNGYLNFKKDGKYIQLQFDRPSNECKRLFKFSKSKMESFIFDLEKLF